MASALASQLQVLASSHGPTPIDKRPITRPSILFDSRRAADIDLQTIFSLAQSGLDELANMDAQFEAYRRTLFGLKNLQINRELQGKEFNAKLDASIYSFLRLLSGFLLLSPAHQTFEYLVRQYKVHVYNVDDVMKSILPYHETSLFVCIVQILQIEKTKWQFLEGIKKSGAAPPRTVLVQQCLQDTSVLEAICDSAMAMSGYNTRSKTILSFSVAMIVEYLGRIQMVDLAIFNRLLPYVLRSFQKGVVRDFRVGGLMILGALVRKTTFSEPTVDMLFVSIAKMSEREVQEVDADRLLQMSLMVMVQITQEQDLKRFPEKAFKFIVKVKDLLAVLAELTKHFNTLKFMDLFVKMLVEHCMMNFHYEQLLLKLIETFPLKLHVELLTSKLLDLRLGMMAAASSQSCDVDIEELKSCQTVDRLLIAMEKYFPIEMSAVIAKYLQQSDDDKKSNRKSSIVKYLNKFFQGTLHVPMQKSNDILQLCPDHVEAQTGETADRQDNLSGQASVETNNSENAGYIPEPLLERQELVLSLMKRRRQFHIDSESSLHGKLSQQEVQLLKSLLQILLQHVDVLMSQNGASTVGDNTMDTLFDALNIGGGSLSDSAVLDPCKIALESLKAIIFDAFDTNTQNKLFQTLLTLYKSDNGEIRSAALSILRNISMNAMPALAYIENLISQEIDTLQSWDLSPGSTLVKFLMSVAGLLEFLVWKVDLIGRETLVTHLFKLLKKLLLLRRSDKTYDKGNKEFQAGFTNVAYVQQLVLAVLESILDSDVGKCIDSMEQLFDIELLVHYIDTELDTSTRNHTLTLLTKLAKLFPDCVLNHVLRVFSILGERTIIQDDSHSHYVMIQLVSAVVPGWLAKGNMPSKLLQIFVEALPQIPVCRRISFVTHILKVMNEGESLHAFLLLLFRSSLSESQTRKCSQKGSRSSKSEACSKLDSDAWPLDFCRELCEQYPPRIKFPAFVNLLINIQSDLKNSASGDCRMNEMLCLLQKNTMDFVGNQLQQSDLHSKFEKEENVMAFEEILVSLMEQVLQILGDRSLQVTNLSLETKKYVHDSAYTLLNLLIDLIPSTMFANSVVHLLKHSEPNIKRKVLQLISLKMKGDDKPVGNSRRKRKPSGNLRKEVVAHSQGCIESYGLMVSEITRVLMDSGEKGSLKLKLAAISALDICAKNFARKLPDTFVSSLSIVILNLQSGRALTLASLHCATSLISHLGASVLPILPDVVTELIKVSQKNAFASDEKEAIDCFNKKISDTKLDILFMCLAALEAIANKLGSFLNPYLQDIVNLFVLHPVLNSNPDGVLIEKAANVQTVFAEKIPARLLLDPLVGTYDMAIEAGESSMRSFFHILSVLVRTLDRPSVTLYYRRIFDVCLAAFGLRCRPPTSISYITDIETRAISVFTGLALKLSESTFKPLFVMLQEWADSEVSDSKDIAATWTINRNIVFYRVVNQLADKLRSIFVPYFHYLLNGCIYHLSKSQEESFNKQKKRTKLTTEGVKREQIQKGLTGSEWHLRHLIISALYKCFLYDTIGFLDASRFQLLLGPIVYQIIVEPASEINASVAEGNSFRTREAIPSISEVDETLTLCLGQMAITVGTDLLWKPLNHEVLLCTRNESVRARRLGLDVVKFLMEHLKEDYLILLPETIPFLAELLEDSELTIVAKSQDIIKHLENLSGESLSQYL